MNLGQLRQEVLNRGFDPAVYGSRITQWINDAQDLIARRCQYYTNEKTVGWFTTAGTSSIPLPPNFARVREVQLTDVNQIVQPVGLRDIDASSPVQARPMYYALSGANILLYPTPDGAYPLVLRFWAMPPTLVADTDIPNLPSDWHTMLWIYPTWMCYEADDDANMGQYWQQRFEKTLAEFEADAKFPSTDYPNQIESMWGGDRGLRAGNQWALYWGY
jgi:hypothetical protein